MKFHRILLALGLTAAAVVGVLRAIPEDRPAPPRRRPARPARRPSAPPADLAPAIAAATGLIPLEYLWSLAWHESRYDPRVVNPFGFVGLFQIHPRWLPAYNTASGESVTAAGLTDPEVNTRIAVWMLEDIIAQWAERHPSLAPDWDAARWVELLTLGYNAGYSERAGVGRVVSVLEGEHLPASQITIDAVRAAAARSGAIAVLSLADRTAHARRTAAGYFLLRRQRADTVRVALVGDSHVAGLEAFVRAEVEARGGKLDAVYQDGAQSRALPDLYRPTFDAATLVILVAGTNDTPARDDPEDYERIVGEVSRVYGSEVRRVVWWGPPVLFRPDLVELPAFVSAHAGAAAVRAGAEWIDSRPFTGDRADYDAAGVHPRRGYASWARQALAATVASGLQEAPS